MTRLQPSLFGLHRWHLQLALVLTLCSAAACGDDDHGGAGTPDGDAGTQPEDAGAPRVDAGGGGGIGGSGPHDDAGPDPVTDAGMLPDDAGSPPFGGLEPDTDFSAHEIDLFGTPGHRFWFEVSEQQLARMNLARGGGFPGGGPIFDALGNVLAADDPLALALERDGVRLDAPIIGGFEGELYTPGNGATFADHLVVEDADTGRVADYGQVEAKLVGESTGRSWDFLNIPNIKVDTNEFEKDKRIGGFEHIRFNNGLVGSIFREALAHRIYRKLGYPALRSSWAFIGSNVWDDDVWVPMVLMEVYKKKFCKDNAELLGGGSCENMWEFPGGVGEAVGSVVPDSACQISECDNTRLEELNDAIAMTPVGPGIKPELEELLDWDRYHQFQCLSWMLWTGDDPIHGGNNNLIIEREDGRLIWAPYSVDISAGQDWYTNVPLVGTSPIATRCQADSECWADTIETCEELIEKFDELNPEDMVDDARETLDELGMLRDGDEHRAEEIREWYVQRQKDLPDELERFRYLPDEFGNCPEGLMQCGDGGCGTTEQCEGRLCALGQTWCESKQACVDTRYEPCPTCRDPKPLHCHLNDRCVADQEACWASCGATPGQVYCAMFDSCVTEGECPSDDDGGVIDPPYEL